MPASPFQYEPHPPTAQDKLDPTAARDYLLTLAAEREITLPPDEAQAIAQAADGYPLLMRGIVAQVQPNDRKALMTEILHHEGDFDTQVEAMYTWIAAHISPPEEQAWRALPLFPANWAPEAPLRTLVSLEGMEALRDAAVVDFFPDTQDWAWHPSVAEYAAKHWPWDKDQQRQALLDTLPAWTEWMKNLPENAWDERIEAAIPNLEPLLTVAEGAPDEVVWNFLEILGDTSFIPYDKVTFWEPYNQLLLSLAKNDFERAQAYHGLGTTLFSAEKWEAALQATQEAVAIYRVLADENPSEFAPDLAANLARLGKILLELEQPEDAIEATQEAIAHYRQIVANDPTSSPLLLASNLITLSNTLITLDRREDALHASQEATDILRQSLEESNKAHTDTLLKRLALASNIDNLGAILSELERFEEAAERWQEAAAIYREAMDEKPEVISAWLADILHKLGQLLAQLARKEEALETLREAADLFRALSQEHPHQMYTINLGMVLNDLGDLLIEFGLGAEALEAAQEASDIFSQLVKEDRDHVFALRRSLHIVREAFYLMGEMEKLIGLSQAMVDSYRRLVARDSQAFTPILADSLAYLGTAFTANEQDEEALAAIQESIDLYRQLAEEDPQEFTPYLADNLFYLGMLLNKLERYEESLKATQKATHYYRQLAAENPQAFTASLALSLSSLGEDLFDLGKEKAAQQAAQEAVKLYRQLTAEDPQTFTPALLDSLTNLGNYLYALGKMKAARRVVQEAITIVRPLTLEDPQTFALFLARDMEILGSILSAHNQHRAAADAFHEGIDALLHPNTVLSETYKIPVAILVRYYLAACKNARQKPDPALMQRVSTVMGLDSLLGN